MRRALDITSAAGVVGDAIREYATCTEIGWFAPGEMPDDLTRVMRINLAHYRQRKQREQEERTMHKKKLFQPLHRRLPIRLC